MRDKERVVINSRYSSAYFEIAIKFGYPLGRVAKAGCPGTVLAVAGTF